jgi:hypothetical protein
VKNGHDPVNGNIPRKKRKNKKKPFEETNTPLNLAGHTFMGNEIIAYPFSSTGEGKGASVPYGGTESIETKKTCHKALGWSDGRASFLTSLFVFMR